MLFRSGMQLRMLAAAGGDPARIRVYTPEEAESLGDQIGPKVVERVWEYCSIAAEARPSRPPAQTVIERAIS